MSEKTKIKAVVLDLDQTLTSDTGSWIELTSLLGVDPNLHKKIYNDFKIGSLNYEDAKRKLIDLWKTSGKTKKNDLLAIFDKIELREGAFEAIEYLKSKYQLCIISGAIDIFVETIAKKLGIESLYASTKFIFDYKGELVDFDYLLDRGREKLTFFNDYCNKHNIKPEECAAIGDGESDMPIFERVGLPILFLAAETTDEQKAKIKTQISQWKKIKNLL